jgi:hypothetical protein
MTPERIKELQDYAVKGLDVPVKKGEIAVILTYLRLAENSRDALSKLSLEDAHRLEASCARITKIEFELAEARKQVGARAAGEARAYAELARYTKFFHEVGEAMNTINFGENMLNPNVEVTTQLPDGTSKTTIGSVE